MKLRTEQTVKTGLRKRCGGSMGSGARRSTRTKAVSSTTAPTKSPMIVAEPHGYVVPPHSRPRTRAEEPSATSTMPA